MVTASHPANLLNLSSGIKQEGRCVNIGGYILRQDGHCPALPSTGVWIIWLRRGLAAAWSQLLAIRLLLVPIGVGVGIGIGIDSDCVLWLVLKHAVASLPEFRQHRHDAVPQSFMGCVPFWRKRPTDLQGIPDGAAALQRGTACNLEIASSISVSGFAVAFGNVQRDRLRSSQKLVPLALR
jgi:hypothetical protein